MISTKILLYKSKKKANGTYPVALRIIKDRKPKYIFLDYIKEKDWDDKNNKVKSSHIHYEEINNLALNKLTLANNLILNAKAKNQVINIDLLISKVKNNRVGVLTFFEVVDNYLNELEKLGKIGTKIRYSSDKNVFKKFLKNKDISFEEITVSLLKKYIVYLKTNNNKDLTVANRLTFIRAIFNKAIQTEEIEKKYYPFGKGKIQIVKPKTMRIGLDKSEIKRLESLKLEKESNLWHDLNLFLFSFYLAGIRISDTVTLKWDNIQQGRLYYTMRKNQKGDSVRIPKKALPILERYKKYKTSKNDLIFPYLKSYNTNDEKELWKGIRSANSRLYHNLKTIAKLAKIDKKVTFHIARHSFAQIVGNKMALRDLQKLYRHSTLLTTAGYQGDFDHEGIDKALDNVLDF